MKTNYWLTEDQSVLSYLQSFGVAPSKIHRLFAEGRLTVNHKEPVRSLNQPLKKGDLLTVDTAEHRDFLPDEKKLDILYEDDYLLIVNKPAHILVHPDDKSKRGTLCNIVSFYYQNKGYDYSIKYAHRLDTDTSGILLFAKDMLCAAKLNQLIATHTLKRNYLCFTEGLWQKKCGTIDLPIGMDRHHNQRRRISKTGKKAVTHYEVLKEFGDYSLLKVTLKTGRTHQIRVHMKAMNHPILGDELYGGNLKKAPRLCLHSYEVMFDHPVTKQPIHLKKELPFDLKQLMREKRR